MLLVDREAGDPGKSKDWLPKEKQYLVTRKGVSLEDSASLLALPLRGC